MDKDKIWFTAALREELAELEHKQWMEWSKEIAATEPIQQDRLKRWKKFWVPYSQLPSSVKDKDREWADKVLEIVTKEILPCNQ